MCCFFNQGANSGLLLSSEGGDHDFMTLTMSPMSLFGCKKNTTAISIIANLRSLVLTEIYLESTDCILELPADIFRKTVKTPVFIGDHLMDQR